MRSELPSSCVAYHIKRHKNVYVIMQSLTSQSIKAIGMVKKILLTKTIAKHFEKDNIYVT